VLEKPTWSMVGVLSEKRELKTKKDEVWAYSLKLMALGGMYSVTTKDKALFDRAAEGEVVQMTGTFEQYNGQVQLVLFSVETESSQLTKSKAS
jgi:hypothetical protein